MKPSHFLLTLAIVALATAAAIAEEPPSEEIKLRYVLASEFYHLIEQEFGPSVVAPTTAVDIRMNSLKLDPANPQARKVRELIAEVDRSVRH